MASSYRSDLKSGSMREWESKLRQAIGLIESVADEVWECIGSDGQFDNAADDGELRGTLCEAVELLRAELPMTPGERAKRIVDLERELATLKRGEG